MFRSLLRCESNQNESWNVKNWLFEVSTNEGCVQLSDPKIGFFSSSRQTLKIFKISKENLQKIEWTTCLLDTFFRRIYSIIFMVFVQLCFRFVDDFYILVESCSIIIFVDSIFTFTIKFSTIRNQLLVFLHIYIIMVDLNCLT